MLWAYVGRLPQWNTAHKRMQNGQSMQYSLQTLIRILPVYGRIVTGIRPYAERYTAVYLWYMVLPPPLAPGHQMCSRPIQRARHGNATVKPKFKAM